MLEKEKTEAWSQIEGNVSWKEIPQSSDNFADHLAESGTEVPMMVRTHCDQDCRATYTSCLLF